MDFQSLVELAPWTTIAQICNLLLQIVLFKKLLFKPIQNILAKRQQEVDSLYDEANSRPTPQRPTMNSTFPPRRRRPAPSPPAR